MASRSVNDFAYTYKMNASAHNIVFVLDVLSKLNRTGCREHGLLYPHQLELWERSWICACHRHNRNGLSSESPQWVDTLKRQVPSYSARRAAQVCPPSLCVDIPIGR